MAYVIYATEAEAIILQTRIDNAFGWPRVGRGICQAVRIGGGQHVDHPLCCTQHHCAYFKHPTLNLWAVPIDDKARPISGTIVEVALTPDWSRL